jgi:hypothetical protein
MKKIDVSQAIVLLANIGVIAGIAFLALELRQNDETQRLLAAQQVLGLAFTNGVTAATSESLSEAMVIAEAGGELTPTQQNQVNAMVRAVMNGSWQVYFQNEQGFLEPEFWEAYERRGRRTMASPLWQTWWNENREIFSVGFQDYIDSLIEESDTE